LEEALNPFKSPELKKVREIRERFEEELEISGIKVSLRAKIFSASVVALIIAGTFIMTLIGAPHLWREKALLPSSWFVIGLLMMVGGFGLIFLVPWIQFWIQSRKRSL
jgi:hypothetical protein